MIPYVKDDLTVSCLSDTHFCGEIGEFFDRFISNRITGDLAVREILRETEETFETKIDDQNMPIGMWQGEFWGKLVLSMCRVYLWKKDGKIKKILSDTVEKVLSYQDGDGYIGTYKDPKYIMHADPVEGAKVRGHLCEWNWNIWCRKYTLWAMLEAYEILGDEKILTACRRFSDCLIETLKEQNVHICETGTFFGTPSGSILKPMLLLYRITGEQRYFELARSIADGFENDSTHCIKIISKALSDIPVHMWGLDIPKTDARILETCGKIYETLSCYDGILELYRLTGEARYLTATEKFIELLMKYEYNTLFSVGFNDVFIFGGSVQDSITEHCDVIHFMRVLGELYKLTSNVRYMHIFDLAFINPYLAGIRRDCKWGARGIKSAGQHMYAFGQSGMKHSHCCVNNIPRGFVNAAECAVMHDHGRVYVNLYLPASADIDLGNGERIGLKVSDGYMQHCKVSIGIDASINEKKALMLRIPDWSKKTAVSCDGESFDAACGEYLEIPIKNGGHEIEIAFDSTPVICEPYFNRQFYPLTDYMKERYKSCELDFECLTKCNMATVRYGAVLLALASEDGYTKDELYRRETIYGKGFNCNIIPAEDNRFRCSYRVTFSNKEKEMSLKMHDFASASDHVTENGFSVFI